MTPPAAAPPALDSCYWLLFSRDHDPSAAKTRFTERFHVPPAFCLPQSNGWWIGPLPEGDLWKTC